MLTSPTTATPAPTNAGTYAVKATVNDNNYEGTATGTLVIEKAQATLNLSDLSQTYNGNPRQATVATVPAGLNVDVTYDGNAQAPNQRRYLRGASDRHQR